ncbi:MAG: type III pantothenate kinase [Acidobacteriota bacterium]|nr:type III pantothenate kinase [Acidobacteriota bacterium]
MLIAFDIGNTTIGIGLFDGRKLVRTWRIRSERDKTADEYAVLLRSLLRDSGFGQEGVRASIISSVVPPLTPVFQALGADVAGTRPLVVGPGLKTGMPILYEPPSDVGADRIVAATAAYEIVGGACIVVDFGTATTFDAVSARGEYLGGAIAPGVLISAEALYLKTAKLPRIEIRKPAKAVGKTTVGSMQSGLYHGYIGLTVNIIREIRRELDPAAAVIATGGFGEMMAAEVPEIGRYEPDLVLEGLRLIYDRNQSSEPASRTGGTGVRSRD